MASTNVRIGANSSEFQKQMREVNQHLKLMNSECGVATQKAKLFGDSTAQLTAKQKDLTSKIQAQTQISKLYGDRIVNLNSNLESQKKKQGELTSKIDEASKKYKESCEATGKNSEESKKLKDELDKLNKQYDSNEKAIESSNKQLVDANIKLNNNEKNLMQNQKALEEVNKEIKNSKLNKLSEDMDKLSNASAKASDKLKPFSTAIAGIGVASAGASIQFETAMAKVSTIADDTIVSYDDMKGAILDLSNQTGISANLIADDVYNAISAGQDTADAVNFVSNSTKLAKAGFAESGQALDILTTIMNSYGMEADKVGEVSDTLIQIQNKGKTTVADLSATMGKIIPTAKSMGVELSQLGAGYALMTSKGIATAETTTYMNSLLNELGKSGTKASKALKKGTGKTFQELTASGASVSDVLVMLDKEAKKSNVSLSDMFGSAEAGKASLILAGNSGKDFNNLLKDMKNSAGGTDEAFEKVNNTTGNKLTKSLNELKNTGIKLGDAIAPVISVIASGFSGVTKVLSSMDESQLKLIASIGGGIITVNLALGAFSKFTGGIRDGVKAYKSFKENGTKAIEHLGKFKNSVVSGTKSVATFASNIGKNLVKALSTLGRGLLNGIKSIGTFAFSLGKTLVTSVASAIGAIGRLILSIVVSGFQFAVQAVKVGISVASLVIHKGVTLGTTLAIKAMTVAQGALNLIMSLNPIVLVIGLLVALGAVFVVLYNKCEWFRNAVNTVWTYITQIFTKFSNYLSGAFAMDWTEKFGVFGNILNAFFKNVDNIWTSIKKIFSGIIDFVGGVFTGDWSRAWEGVKNIFGGIMNGLGAVIKAPLNTVIGLINMAIDGLNRISFTTPDWVPFVGGKHFGVNLPKIRYLYQGGIINSPTFLNSNTVVGDAYKGRGNQAEAVIPLDIMYKRLRNIVREETAKEGDSIIYIENSFSVDGKKLVKETVKKTIQTIDSKTKSYTRSKGGRILA